MITFDRTGIPEPFLAGIGRINVEFQKLESALTSSVWHLFGIDQASARVVTTKLSFRAMKELFGSLVHHWFETDEDVLVELKDIMKQLESAEVKRNDIIHCTWMRDSSEDGRLRFKLKANGGKALTVVWQSFTAGDLAKWAEEIAVAHDEFFNFCLARGIYDRPLPAVVPWQA